MAPAQIVAASPIALSHLVTIDGDEGPTTFDLFPYQRELLGIMRANRRVIILKARQIGTTTLLGLYALWFIFAHASRTVLILSRGEREASVMLTRIKRMYSSLPSIIQGAYPVEANSSERFSVYHPEGSSVIVSLPGTGGRSETSHLLLLDEGAHWENASERLAAVLPTAADSGSVVMASTANGEGDPFERTYNEAPLNGWTPVFFDAKARPTRSDSWVETMRAGLKELGPQEYPMNPEEAFLSSGRSAFDLKDLKDIRDCCDDPPWRGQFQTVGQEVKAVRAKDGQWSVWEWPRRGRNYLISADVCGGQGGSDFSVAYVLDVDSWDMIAKFKGRPEPDVFARELARAGYIYSGPAGPALLAWEVNGHGAGVTAILKGRPGQRPYPRLYQREVFDQRQRKTRMELGWLTDSKSRFRLVSALQEMVRERTCWIRDAEWPLEARRFVWRETKTGGRFEAAEGEHDDHVMALGLGIAILGHSIMAKPPEPSAPLPPRRPRVSSITGY